VPPTDRDNTGFRLPPDDMKRLDKAARFRGLSRQKFIEAAVLAEVAEVERKRHDKKVEREGNALERTNSVHDVPDGAPSGLGITAAIRARAAAPVDAPPAEQQKQVVVNVGNGGGSGGAVHSGDAIERLANYVIGAKDFERDVRLRKAVDILRDTAATDEERKVLAARLDEAIAAKTGKADGGGNGIVRTARIAFDKLADILR